MINVVVCQARFLLLLIIAGGSFLITSCHPDQEAKKQYLSSQEIQAQLKKIWHDDQIYRARAGQLRQENKGVRTPEEGELWAKQTILDSINMNLVEAIIEKVGYPTKTMVGDSLKHVAALVIMHNPKRQSKYVNTIWSAARNGDILLTDAATLEDRVLMFAGKNQKYGTQMKYDTISIDKKSGTVNTQLRIWPIENAKIVDSLRASIGLYPLSRQCEMMNLDCSKVKGYTVK